ncbi:MAG: hypothetical protein GEV08_25125 [Acidimicrobiia bacterium]|nr:hypothetical protein [Acidimicrobiia bacterium]
MTISVDQLRLGVSFAHAVPSALLTIHLDRGRSLRCAHDRCLEPDVHPCQARQLVAGARGGGPTDWLGEVVGLELGGPRLVDEGGGLYRAEAEAGRSWSFATTLCPVDAHEVVAEALAAAFDERGMPAGEDDLSSLDLRALIDRSLDVVVVTCPETGPAAPVSATEAARRSLGACLVAELCGAAAAERRLR